MRPDVHDGTDGSSADLSFSTPAVQKCPFALYDRLRVEAPVYKDPVTGNYVLTRYADVRKTLLDTKTFSSRNSLGATRAGAALDAVNKIYDENGWRIIDMLQSQDPPEHRTYRQLVDKAFAPKRIDELEPRINEIVHGLIDSIIDKPEVEFLTEFAIKLPMTVIAEQLGVDAADMDKFKIWSDAVTQSLDPTLGYNDQIQVANRTVEMQQYLAAAIERIRKTPNDKLLSRLVHAEVEGRSLNMSELQNISRQLIVAGNETTTASLAAGMKLLVDQPELVDQLRSEPELMRNFVEETLRLMSPAQTLFRRVMRDVEIAGVTIPEGALVEVRYGAANRDPAEFDEPARFDLKRNNAKSHIAFGFGPHMCIGNQLARGELRLAFAALIDRLDNFRLARGEDSYVYTPNFVAFGMSTLWIAFDRR